MATGYSGKELWQKLGIKSGMRVAAIAAPENYQELLGGLPEDVRILERPGRSADLIHVFTKSRERLEAQLPALKQRIPPDGMIWVSWPKSSSGVDTDLNEDRVREVALGMGLVDIKVCAVDDTWSGLKLVIRVKDRPKK